MEFVSPIFDLYSDYLLVNQGQPTATRLSALVDGKLSHDAITRSLHQQDYHSRHLWQVRGRPLGLGRGKILRFGSLPTSEQGGLPYGAAEYQLYARIQDPPCFICFRLKWKFGRYGPLARV